jgi:acylphosphatase
MSPEIIRLHAIVRGRVQGVGFRFFAQREAETLSLTGWVANCRDRSVEVVAEGSRDALDRFLQSLRRGPASAHVTHVDAEFLSATHEFDQFRVEL